MAGAREEEIEGRRRGVKGVKERVVSFRRKYMYMYNQQLTPCNDSDQYYEICCTCTCSYIQHMAHVYTLYSFPHQLHSFLPHLSCPPPPPPFLSVPPSVSPPSPPVSSLSPCLPPLPPPVSPSNHPPGPACLSSPPSPLPLLPTKFECHTHFKITLHSNYDATRSINNDIHTPLLTVLIEYTYQRVCTLSTRTCILATGGCVQLVSTN